MARMSAARTPALAERWVDAFREGWRAPADADSLIEHVRPFIATDARFVQLGFRTSSAPTGCAMSSSGRCWP